MIYWNADLAAKIRCSSEEMKILPSYIDYLVGSANKIAQGGIQPTSGQFSSEKDDFFRYGLLLVGEGLSGEILEEILAVLLYVSKAEVIDFLKQCIAAEAILSIANGEDEEIMLRKLLPYCGIDVALDAIAQRKSEHAD
ncbi:MAG: hypothetical protein ABFC21_05975 [Rectinema sp.]